MAQCVKALYNAFPGIRAFGCCHEVFGTKRLLADAVMELEGAENVSRDDIKINVVGVNHFTWLTEAHWQGKDLFPLYRRFAEKYKDVGYNKQDTINELNASFANSQQVKFDLFLRYGYIAAAGDRHLAEFCPKNWYLRDAEWPHRWGFGLTSVAWRKERQLKRIEKGKRRASGEEPVEIKVSGEEGVAQIRALLGLRELVTNVNLPNVGQIPNLPLGTIVETNAAFRDDSLTPLFAGPIPAEIDALVRRIAGAQVVLAEAARQRDLKKAFGVFLNDPLMDLPADKARALFDEMIEGTKEYLKEYL